jgi:hypothetical protein
MNSEMNKYLSGWISKRTLNLASAVVTANSDSDNAIDININIRFVNTIEVINITIVIE